MSKYIGDRIATAVEVPCTAPGVDDVFVVDQSDPTKGKWQKAATNNIADNAIVTGKLANGAVSDAKLSGITGTNFVGGAGALAKLDNTGRLVDPVIKDSDPSPTGDRKIKIRQSKVVVTDSSDVEKPLDVAVPTTFREKVVVNKSAAFIPTYSDGMPYAGVWDRQSTNVVSNPSFEIDVSGWTSTANATLSRITTQYLFGTAAAQVVVGAGGGAQGIQSNVAAANPGEYWAASAFLKAASGTINAQIYIDFLNASQVLLATAGAFNTAVTEVGTTWTRLADANTAVAPANTAYARMRIVTSAASVTFYVDGCQLEKRPSALVWESTYLDGTMGPGFAWQGAPHNSASTRSGGFHPLGPMSDQGNVADPTPAVTIWDDGSVEATTVWGRTAHGIRSGAFSVAELVGDEFEGGSSAVRLRAARAEGRTSSTNVDLYLNPNGSGKVISDAKTLLGPSGSRMSIAGAGNSFPGSPTANDVFFRTDRGALYYFDGTAWKSFNPAENCAFAANTATATSLGFGGWTKVVFDSEFYDYGSNYSTSTSTFTAPATGLYDFSWSVRVASVAANEWVESSLFVNGTNSGFITGRSFNGTGGAQSITTQGAVRLSLTATNTVDVRVWNDDTANRFTNGSAWIWWTGKRVT